MTSYVENTGKYCHDKSSSFGDDGKKNPWMLGDGTAPPNQENEAVSAACNIRACIKQHPRHLPIHYVFIIYIFTSSSILYICIICLFLSLSVILCIFHIQTTQGSRSHIGGFLKLGYPQIIQVIN